MIKPSCAKARRLLLQSEGGDVESADALWLESHVQGCEGCRREGEDLATIFRAWRALDPPRLGSRRMERMERAVLSAPVSPGAPPRPGRTWKVPTIAAGVAATLAVASLALLWYWRQPVQSRGAGAARLAPAAPALPRARVQAGHVLVFGPTGEARALGHGSTLPPGVTLHSPRTGGGVIAWGSRATLGLAAGAQVSVRRRGERPVITLVKGTVSLDVGSTPGRHGAGLSVWVPGSGEVIVGSARVLLSRQPGNDLRVAAVRGEVMYRWSHSGSLQEKPIEAGQILSHRLDRVRLLDAPGALSGGTLLAAGVPTPSHTRPPVAARMHAVAGRPRSTGCSLEALQGALARGQAKRVLRGVASCRAAGQASRALDGLEARANLQLGRVRRAFAQFLALAHSLRGTQQGQTALYSAGRIAWTRLARKGQARHLLEHYLETYPKGAYRASVRQILRRL